MAWSIRGRSLELCNCKQFCPCWLGPTGEPDQGWCGAAFGYDIKEGTSDGVDLGGCQVALGFEWPGNFFEGNGSARLYVDESASAEQRRELEAIFGGKKGGPLEAVWDAMSRDKKARAGQRRFVLLRDIGQVEVVSDVRRDDALAVLEELRI